MVAYLLLQALHCASNCSKSLIIFPKACKSAIHIATGLRQPLLWTDQAMEKMVNDPKTGLAAVGGTVHGLQQQVCNHVLCPA